MQSPERAAYRINVDRIYQGTNGYRASVSLVIGPFMVHGLRVYDTDRGRFVSMPSRPARDENGQPVYLDVFHPFTAEARQRLTEDVLDAFDRKLREERDLGFPHVSRETSAPKEGFEPALAL